MDGQTDSAPGKHPGGQPTAYTPERVAIILEAVEDGNPRKIAAHLAGIGESTLYEWARERVEFAEAITRADAECHRRNVAVLKKASLGVAYERRIETIETVLETRTTTEPDGTVVTEKVPVEKRTVRIETGSDYDWRPSLEVLKRRWRTEWGDSIDINKISPEQALAILAADADREGGEGRS